MVRRPSFKAITRKKEKIGSSRANKAKESQDLAYLASLALVPEKRGAWHSHGNPWSCQNKTHREKAWFKSAGRGVSSSWWCRLGFLGRSFPHLLGHLLGPPTSLKVPPFSLPPGLCSLQPAVLLGFCWVLGFGEGDRDMDSRAVPWLGAHHTQQQEACFFCLFHTRH